VTFFFSKTNQTLTDTVAHMATSLIRACGDATELGSAFRGTSCCRPGCGAPMCSACPIPPDEILCLGKPCHVCTNCTKKNETEASLSTSSIMTSPTRSLKRARPDDDEKTESKVQIQDNTTTSTIILGHEVAEAEPCPLIIQNMREQAGDMVKYMPKHREGHAVLSQYMLVFENVLASLPPQSKNPDVILALLNRRYAAWQQSTRPITRLDFCVMFRDALTDATLAAAFGLDGGHKTPSWMFNVESALTQIDQLRSILIKLSSLTPKSS
jgi:hypothetical protein